MERSTLLMLNRTRIALLAGGVVVLCVVIGVSTWYGGQNTAQASAASQVVKDCDALNKDTGTEPWLNLHLPTYTVPLHYNLTLYPDFYGSHESFYGNVTIRIEVKQATRHLLVHNKRLSIKTRSVRDVAGVEYGIEKEFSYDPNQFWVIQTKRIINESTIVLLDMQFNGSLSDGIVGFYKAYYDDRTRAMATSKFEPVDARKAFPCFDEPNLKATFTTTLVHRPEYTALSNMPIKSVTNRTDMDGLVASTFQKSVPMSTYLACFIVCNCSYKEVLLKSGKPFRVYAVPDRIDQVDYALHFGKNVTDYFENYFGLDYPLPKMDMIAIPDFVSGAMEHWGLITYRETNLLYKEGISSVRSKQTVAEVVAHELAHQWFGNIVTMDWWDDLWLNEGFATFMSYVGTDPFEPLFDVHNQFVAVEVFTVMPMDSQVNSHPIIVPVYKPEEITSVFDAISYNKGAAVIRMLEAIVGKDVFKRGLQAYLKKYRYGNAKTFQLWDSISDEARMDVGLAPVMDTWTKQSGFPLVQIQYNNLSNHVVATQELFKPQKTMNESLWPRSPFGYKWEIPLHYSSSNGVSSNETLQWLNVSQSSVTLPSPVNLSDPSQWVKFNREGSGYYKVNYDRSLWMSMARLMSSDSMVLPPADRASLAYDALTLAFADYLDYDVALTVLNYIENETHYVPWSSIAGELYSIRDLVQNSTWNEYVLKLVRPRYLALGWDDASAKPHLDQLLQGTVIRLACGHQMLDCIAEAERIFTNWSNTGQPIPASIRRDAFSYGMVNASEQQWQKAWQEYQKEMVASVKLDIMRGLANSGNLTLIKRLLDYAMDKSKVPDQDFFNVITFISGNPKALEMLWQWIKENYGQLRARFGDDHRNFGRMVPGIVDQFSNHAQLLQVEEFYKEWSIAGAGERPRQQALEQIKTNILWVENHKESVLQAALDLMNPPRNP